jgi:hypothetical protein
MRGHSPARGRDAHSAGPDKLLGAAERRHTRKRGFVPWQPKEGTKTILAQINEVLEDLIIDLISAATISETE